MPAETCKDEFHLLFIDGALKYIDELSADIKKGTFKFSETVFIPNKFFYNYKINLLQIQEQRIFEKKN